MKIICDSKWLQKSLLKVNRKTKIVKVENGVLKFGRIKINVISYYNDNFEFDPVVWHNVMVFVETIPHQPVTLYLNDSYVRISCEVEFK